MSKLLQELLYRPVDLKKLIDNISFNPDELERAALHQPGLYLEASRYRTLKMRKKNRAFVEKDKTNAQLGLHYRRKKKDGDKMTEGAVKDSMLYDPARVKAQEALDRATEEETWAQALVEVFRQRLSVIKVLAEIRNAEISAEVRQARNNMEMAGMRKAAEKARQRHDLNTDIVHRSWCRNVKNNGPCNCGAST